MSTIERAIEKLNKQPATAEQPVAPVEEVVASDVRPPTDPTMADVAVVEATPESKAATKISDAEEDSSSRIQLDLERLAKSGIVTPDAERSQTAEEFRHIKRPLLMNAFGQGALSSPNPNLIMVTSASPGEGKTFTAVNLALSIALERDRTVLLVDADVARPSVARVLDFPGSAGLVDYLADHDRPLAKYILQTSIAKLRLLPAGRRHAHSTELLASQSMLELAQELAMRYSDRVVIFDSPPLLATSEAAVLASLMGQIVMVVEAEKTNQERLKEALAVLDPEQFVGLVLNKSNRPFGAEYYYGSYASYGE